MGGLFRAVLSADFPTVSRRVTGEDIGTEWL